MLLAPIKCFIKILVVYPVEARLVCVLSYVARESILPLASPTLVYVTETKMDSKSMKTRGASVLIATHKNL
jgi:hypothetical protein